MSKNPYQAPVPPQGEPSNQPNNTQQGYQQQGNPNVVYVAQPKKPWYKRLGCMIPLGIVGLIVIGAAINPSGGDHGQNTGGTTSAASGDAAGAAAAGSGNGGAENPGNSAGQNVLRYEVVTSGGTNAMISYLGQGGQSTQDSEAVTPWNVEIPAKNKWDLLGANLSAQNKGDGDITCRAFWNGEQVATNTSHGAYAVVSCNPKL